jgi:predicted ribosomally synthesized peptide with SipW-like signal peptide
MPRIKLLFGLGTLIIAVALLGGATAALFMAKADASVNEFTAGTLLISADAEVLVNEENWNPGQEREAVYSITNQGSKCSLLRASLEGRWYCQCGDYVCNTAMVRMYDDPTDFTYLWPEHPWFSYIIHKPTLNVQTFYFSAGQTHRVGEVNIWKDDEFLYIEIKLDDDPPNDDHPSEYVMSESQVNVVTSLAELTALPGNGLAFGTWPYKEDYDPKATEDQYVIPWDNNWDGKELYIGVHAGVCGYYFSTENGGCVEFCPPHYDDDGLVEVVSFEPCDDSWIPGDDGYFYYVGGDSCLEELSAGETAEFCVKVHLDGDKTDDRYQNKEFRFEATFEAIQCTNNAAQENGWLYFCNHN